VVVCSPPEGATGLPSAVVMAAAALGGADRVFALGGAGAIAAMAYGTATVPRVDRIVGPGNAYVAEAKLQCAGAVAIDSPAGPSEVLVLADAAASAEVVAREMLGQAEHDPLACAVAVVVGERQARAVAEWLDRLAGAQPRRAIVEASLGSRGGVLWCDDLDEAIALANAYAAEHLIVMAGDADGVVARCRNAGTIFVGESASNAFGDYMTGANHVLPSGGLARSYSGLSVLDFVRWTTYQRVTPAAAAGLADDVGTFADAEGLPGHAIAARAWRDAPVAPGVGEGAARATGQGVLAPRAGYEAIRLYDPGVAPSLAIDLSDNTNRWGLPPAAARAIRALDEGTLTRYPSLFGGELKGALAAMLGVDAGMVVTGNGSDGILEPAIRAFAEPGDRLAHPDPSFVMIATFARMNGLVPVPVPLTPTYDVDADAMLATGARIIYLCSPNNPTGNTMSRDALRRVVREAPGLVILDEAYAEFAGWSAVELLGESDRLLVTRTMSKAFGLAGLRVGYGVGSPAVVQGVEKARGPYTVSVAAEAAAIAALREDRQWVRDTVAEAVAVRASLDAALRAMGLEPVESGANFVFVPCRDAVRVGGALASRGIAVRAFSGLPPVSAALRESGGEALRINVAPRAVVDTVIAALREVLR
jgi:histidinol dehydrogenase